MSSKSPNSESVAMKALHSFAKDGPFRHLINMERRYQRSLVVRQIRNNCPPSQHRRLRQCTNLHAYRNEIELWKLVNVDFPQPGSRCQLDVVKELLSYGGSHYGGQRLFMLMVGFCAAAFAATAAFICWQRQ